MLIQDTNRRDFVKLGGAALAVAATQTAKSYASSAASYAKIVGANDRVRTGIIGCGDRMLGGDLKSRLWLRIREKEGFSYGVGSALVAAAKSPFAQFMVQATAVPQNIPKVEDAFKDELAKALKDGFTGDEVAAAKKTYLEERMIGRTQDAGLARMLAQNEQFGWTMAREADLDSKVAALPPAQINAAARKYLDPAAISYVKAGDFKKAGLTP